MIGFLLLVGALYVVGVMLQLPFPPLALLAGAFVGAGLYKAAVR